MITILPNEMDNYNRVTDDTGLYRGTEDEDEDEVAEENEVTSSLALLETDTLNDKLVIIQV